MSAWLTRVSCASGAEPRKHTVSRLRLSSAMTSTVVGASGIVADLLGRESERRRDWLVGDVEPLLGVSRSHALTGPQCSCAAGLRNALGQVVRRDRLVGID